MFTQHPVLKGFHKRGEYRTYADGYGRSIGSSFEVERDQCEFYAPEHVCLWRCPGCGRLCLEVDGRIAYPMGSSVEPNQHMPADAQAVFREAQRIINASPRAACAMLRVCVERMVNAKMPKGKSLAEKTEALNLPVNMRKLANACRLVGNDAVHSNVIDFSVGSEEATAVSEALTRFSNRLADELFGMQEEADALEERIKSARARNK